MLEPGDTLGGRAPASDRAGSRGRGDPALPRVASAPRIDTAAGTLLRAGVAEQADAADLKSARKGSPSQNLGSGTTVIANGSLARSATDVPGGHKEVRVRGQLMPSELEMRPAGGFRIVKRQRTERGATEHVTIGAKVVPAGPTSASSGGSRHSFPRVREPFPAVVAAERLQPGHVVANRGVQVRLSPDRQSIVASGSGIRSSREAAAPLMWPYQRDGKPPACSAGAQDRRSDHRGRRVLGRAAWCGGCWSS